MWGGGLSPAPYDSHLSALEGTSFRLVRGHGHPEGDRFYLLNRGQMMETFERGAVTREQLVQAMAGGAELEVLEHELESITRQ